ncbi:probable E3 SUMO-protein ligase RNF212 isoform X2 [Pomacea canaliculata]|nr:probable E3 SUMO-protein ligase RNF212 isoform X2 [Pomacea canaliculata]XP_025115889.1 probable E3 SUMO-protein ligase RNF212 isoform X2 [Pomacea canaliculata]
MADWLHCNLCFLQPGDGTPFHITSCGHIYCDGCVEKGSKVSCSMCASKCSTLELSGKMKPDVESFFLDPVDVLNKAFKKFVQTWEFQRNHRRRLFSHMSAKVLELNKMVLEATKVVSKMQSLEKEVIKLREENIYLKKLLQDKGFGSTSRPLPRALSSPTGFRNSPSVTRASNYTINSPYSHCNSSYQLQSTNQPSSIQLTASITPGRLIARTPPSGGRMGTVGGSSSNTISLHRTPQSVAHNIYPPTLQTDNLMSD